MSVPLPSDSVLEALFSELEAAGPGRVSVEGLAARHGVEVQLVRDLVTSLQVLEAGAGPAVGGPQRLGPYELLEVLGSGGMGRVYRARHPGLEREVALKVQRAGGAASAHERARFLREAEALATLQHPHVLRIHTAGQGPAGSYLVLELVEGARPISEAALGLDWREQVALIRDAARGLGYAHAKGVVHRDVKPDNLLVDRAGHVRVSDFGLARVRSAERLTQTGTMLGTVGYMAPEQLRGQTARQGPPADVWALGVVLFELLAGRTLFPASESKLADLEARARSFAPPPLRREAPEVPLALERVWRKALAERPEERYPNAEAFADDLDAVLRGEAPQGSGPNLARPGALLAGSLLLAALAGGAVWLGRSRSGAPSPLVSAPEERPQRTEKARRPRDPTPWEQPGMSPAEEVLAAWRWQRAHPEDPRAKRARTLAAKARREPLCVVAHKPGADSLVRVAFEGGDLVTSGAGRLARWEVPSGAQREAWNVGRLTEARPLAEGGWILWGGSALERWPAGLGRDSPRGLGGRLGRAARVAPGRAVWVRRLRKARWELQLSPDGSRVAVSAGSGVAIVSASGGEVRLIAELPQEGDPRHLTFVGPDRLALARVLALPSGYRSTLELWDLSSGKRLAARPSLAVSSLGYVPEEALLAVGSHRGTLSLDDPTSLETSRWLGDPAHSDAAGSLVYSNDEAVQGVLPLPGRRALLTSPGQDVPSHDRALKWVDLESGEARPLIPLEVPPCSLALSPDGSLLAVGRRDGRAELWLFGALSELKERARAAARPGGREPAPPGGERSPR